MPEEKKEPQFLSLADEAKAWSWRIGAIILILMVVGSFGVGAINKRANKRQSYKFWKEAREMIDKQDWIVAHDKTMAALNLNPNNIDLFRLAGTIEIHIPGGDPLIFWDYVIKHPEATAKDWEDYLEMAITTRRFEIGEPLLIRLLQLPSPSARAFYLSARYYQARRDMPRAIKYARQCVQSDANYADAVILLGSLLAASESEEDLGDAKRILIDLVKRDSIHRAVAINTLAGFQLSKNEAEELFTFTRNESLSNIEDFLASRTVAIKARPTERGRFVEEAVLRYANGTPEELGRLAKWLNDEDEYSETIKAFKTRARADVKIARALVEAYTATSRWEELDTFLGAADLGLDPVYVECVRAKATANLNRVWDSSTHWNQARFIAASDPVKMTMIARLAEEAGAPDIALSVMRKLASFAAYTDEASKNILRLLRQAGRTADLRQYVREQCQLHPNDPSMLAYGAYLDMLLGEDLDKARKDAARHYDKKPTDSNTRIAVALSLLQQRLPDKARFIFESGQDISLLPPHHRSLYAAILGAQGRPQDSRATLLKVPRAELLPEEVAMVKDWLPSTPPPTAKAG